MAGGAGRHRGALCAAGVARRHLRAQLHCDGARCEPDWVCGPGAGAEAAEGVGGRARDDAGECSGDYSVYGVGEEGV